MIIKHVYTMYKIYLNLLLCNTNRYLPYSVNIHRCYRTAVPYYCSKLDNKNSVRKQKKEEKRRLLLDNQKQKHRRIPQSTLDSSNINKLESTELLPETYDPVYTESFWYDWWVKQKYFSPEISSIGQTRTGNRLFVICLPPPNVTGRLHIGHALGNSIQDAIVRWHRMHGKVVVWVPGCDHAGIATQVVVERELQQQGINPKELSRQKLVDYCWDWKNRTGDAIYEQMKRLGSSLDWTRQCFTLDPKMSHAVTEAFVRLHEAGLIYRSKRLVNWSCALRSAISDIEVDQVPLSGRTKLSVPGYLKPVDFGVMVKFAYQVCDSDDEVVVATTRPETMLGDVAVAVHPEDVRYQHLHGCTLHHKITDRKIPLICDTVVDRNMGTGAVKVTPAHDTVDFDLGKRHRLTFLEVIDDKGCMVNVPHPYQGMKRFDARAKVLEHMQLQGSYRGSTDHVMSLPMCSRTGDIIEPRIKEQWFIDCREMADRALQCVEDGELKLVPSSYEHQWNQWLSNIQDWCVSRQLWWGHRVPAYWVTFQDQSKPGVWVSGHSLAEAQEKACQQFGCEPSQVSLAQDEDVLDTWFSSALFPFAVFNWPEQSPHLDLLYPTSLLETASDILFFWVARMVFMGQQLTGQVPFKEVLLHGVLRDSHGRKMSKSLGNVVDPMDVIHGITLEDLNNKVDKSSLSASEKNKAKAGQKRDFPLGIPQCGADALRLTLCSLSFKDHFINMDVEKLTINRKFCNKIWQANKYIMSALGTKYNPSSELKVHELSATDLWLMSRISELVALCDDCFKTYDLNVITKALVNFWWHEFCDIYLEYSKPVLQESSSSAVEGTKHCLYLGLDVGLRCLAPFMPYLTEELFQKLPKSSRNMAQSICIASFPSRQEFNLRNPQVEEEMAITREFVGHIQSIKNMFTMRKARPTVYLQLCDSTVKHSIAQHQMVLQAVGRCGQVIQHAPPTNTCYTLHCPNEDKVHLELKGFVNFEEEIQKQTKQIFKLTEILRELEHKIENKEEHQILTLQTLINSVTAQLNKSKLALQALDNIKYL